MPLAADGVPGPSAVRQGAHLRLLPRHVLLTVLMLAGAAHVRAPARSTLCLLSPSAANVDFTRQFTLHGLARDLLSVLRRLGVLMVPTVTPAQRRAPQDAA